MKKIIFLFLLSFLLGYSSQAQVKIGVVDAQTVLSKSNKGIKIQKQLELIQKQKQDELTRNSEEIKTLEKELQSPALNESSREQKGRELEGLRTNLKRKYEDAQREFQMQSQKSLMDFEKELMPIINSYGKNNGFTVIYDMSSSGIIYFDNAIDVSDEIINILNQQ